MIQRSIAISLIALSLPVLSAHAQEEVKTQTATTPDKRYVSVDEGPGEPTSTGSYALRLYDNSNPEYPTDIFVAGVVQSRDGTVLPLEWADITGDGHKELIITTESAGSGSYLSADAFSLGEKDIKLVASVSDLGPKADVVDALKKAAK